MSLPNFIVHPVGLDLRLGSKELARSGCTELSAVLQVLGSLSQNTAQLQLKTSTFQQVSHSHLISSVKHIHFLLTFGTPFPFFFSFIVMFLHLHMHTLCIHCLGHLPLFPVLSILINVLHEVSQFNPVITSRNYMQ
jgi:hypothetical protein